MTVIVPAPASASGRQPPAAPASTSITAKSAPDAVSRIAKVPATRGGPSKTGAAAPGAPRTTAPKQRRLGRPLLLVLLLAVPVLFVLAALIVSGLVYVLFFRGGPRVPDAPVAQAAALPKDGQAGQAPEPNADPVLLEPLPKSIQPESVKKVKKATVYFKVETADGITGEGSGFFALERGIVLTNAHVVGMLQRTSKAPTKIDIVGNSGQPDEYQMTGSVAGVDRDNDLAVIRVQGEQNRWPEPLAVQFDWGRLVELQPVYIFGFPFGANLGKEVTASPSSISSFRKDGNGLLFQIQVNGGMNPGNSGGPVVDTRGVVVGVSVAGIKGTQINFAVPGEKIQGLVNGRVQDVQLGQPFRDQNQVKLPVRMTFLDPLERIRDMQVEVWTGPAGKSRPASLKQPPALPGDSAKQPFHVKYEAGKANHDLLVGANLPNGDVYWLRPVFVNKDGVKRWGAAYSYKPSDASPLERTRANLAANLASAERSLNLRTRLAVTVTQGGKKVTEADIMNVEVLEVLEKTPKGANVRLKWGKGQFLEEFGGKRAPVGQGIYGQVRNHVHGFHIDDAGALDSFGFVKFKYNNAKATEEGNYMAFSFVSAYQLVSMPMPNREVQSQETWPAKMRLLMGRAQKKDVLDLVLTCTYEGTRTQANRKEAVISLLGEVNVVKTQRPLMRKPTDRVTGTAVFDLDNGHISKLRIALSDERDMKGLLLATVFEADLTRVPGNTYKIVMPPSRGK